MKTAKDRLKLTTSSFHVGSAHRRPDGSVSHYTHGRQEFKSLEHAQSYICGLFESYEQRNQPMAPDEFVPMEIITVIYMP